MRIVADRNIVGLEAAFGHIAEVIMVEGRQLSNVQLKDADALLVRSVTNVDQKLLANTAVAFVGSATAGLDHIDLNYLEAVNIGFSAAPGSNANSVVEYVISALANIEGCLEDLYQGESLGIVGFGHVGSLLAKKLTAIGLSVIAYDPLLPQQSSKFLASFEQILKCKVISVHTPLTREGSYPSYHQFDDKVLRQLRPNTVLINAGRGATVDNRALLSLLQAGSDLKVVLDVWEGEPDISADLLQQCSLSTPHIAGYSYDGKLAATSILCQQLCEHFNIENAIDGGNKTETSAVESLDIQLADNLSATIRAVINSVYDIRTDDQKLRALLSVDDPELRARGFDQLRKQYPQRREINSFKWRSACNITASQWASLAALGCMI